MELTGFGELTSFNLPESTSHSQIHELMPSCRMKVQGFMTAMALAAGLAGLVCICGCASPPQSPRPGLALPPASRDAAKLQLRNNAASLLRDLLDDEKNVSKIFVIKHGGDVKALVELIAATAEANEHDLFQLTNTDADLNLRALDLPPGEKAVRDAIAKSKERELLFTSGPQFEFNLLLTQAEAQNYGWHLAKVAAENSSRPEEVATFTRIGEAMKHLYEQTVREMRQL
jgi:hypothetical protein